MHLYMNIADEMSIWLIVLVVLLAFLGMELVSWFTHRYLMHGFLWLIHLDHHKPTRQTLEKNDLFALLFSLPSIVLLVLGSMDGIDMKFWIGLGIALYGTTYFLYHDVLIHKRLNFLGEPRNRFLKAVVRAHLDHHRGKKNYGFFFMVPWKYFREEFSK